MRFSIPQFIEHEAKIVGPLTFKQSVFIGIAAVICFVLYFLLPFSLFLIISIILIGGGVALAFFKLSGKALPAVLVNVLRFSFGSKIYVWKKKEQPAMIYKKETEKPLVKKTKKEKEKELPLKMAEKSRLKKLHNQMEVKVK